jgi:phenylalanyl-tRNA synthetase beta chain
LHAFDKDLLDGSEVIVRRAIKDEAFTSLDGVELKLDEDTLVIADASKAIALAGIMGGANSQVIEATRNIILEAASFDSVIVRKGSKKYGLRSDSSIRFERGVDFSSTSSALQRAAALIIQFCGGECSNIIDIENTLPKREPIKLRTKRVSDIMGVALKDSDIKSVLDKLNLTHSSQEGKFLITPPSFRFDLSIEEDLVEEVIRIYGYDNIPALIPTSQNKMIASANNKKSIHSVKSALVNLGYNEVVSYSFIDKETDEELHSNLDVIQLQNLQLILLQKLVRRVYVRLALCLIV